MTTSPTTYDLVLNGGTLLDHAQGINNRRDVAFKDGLVANVAERIDGFRKHVDRRFRQTDYARSD